MQELVYTSAPRGLKAGSRGFCTVLSTHGMSSPLATALEGLSGYRPVYPAGDPRAGLNPDVYSHVRLQAAGKIWHVLSRIADYGLDYSQRSNKLAHHLVLDERELSTSGPAALLQVPGLLRTEWQGEPRVVPVRSVPRADQPEMTVCRAWQELTGDAGWAGAVAESFLADPDRLVLFLFEPGQDLLPLFAESIALLPPDVRWKVTFSTYFTGLASGTTCLWRGMPADSREARDSLRFVSALRLDIRPGQIGRATGGSLVAAARGEIAPHSWNSDASGVAAAEVAPPPAVTFEAVEQETHEVFDGASEPPLSTETPPPSPPPRLESEQIQPAASPPARPPRRGSKTDSRRTLADLYAEEEQRPKRWKWVIMALLAGTLLASFGLFAPVLLKKVPWPKQNETDSSAGSQDKTQAQQNSDFKSGSSKSSEPKPVVSQPKETKKAASQPERTASESLTTPTPDTIPSTAKSVTKSSAAQRDNTPTPTAMAEEPSPQPVPQQPTREEKAKPALKFVSLDLSAKEPVQIWEPEMQDEMKGQMDLHFMRPAWVKLAPTSAVIAEDNENQTLKISKPGNEPCATFTVVVVDNRPKVSLTIVDRSQAEDLRWCALRIRMNGVDSTVQFVEPAVSFQVSTGASQVSTWSTTTELPMNGLQGEDVSLSIEHMSLKSGGELFEMALAKSQPGSETELLSKALDTRLEQLAGSISEKVLEDEYVRLRSKNEKQGTHRKETLQIKIWRLRPMVFSSSFDSAVRRKLNHILDKSPKTPVDKLITDATIHYSKKEVQNSDPGAKHKLDELKRLQETLKQKDNFLDVLKNLSVASALITYEVKGEGNQTGKVVVVGFSENRQANVDSKPDHGAGANP